jgi:hypothetical protein
LKLLVILGWLALFGGLVFHFRKVESVSDYLDGFADVVRSVVLARDETRYGQRAYENGEITTAVMLAILALCVAVLAIVTVCLA